MQSIQTSNPFSASNTVYYRDADGDGYGTSAQTVIACGTPVGYVGNNADCNDANAIEKPNQEWFLDADNDSYSSATNT